MWKSLLPQESRVLEIYSGLALLMLSIMSLSPYFLASDLLLIESRPTWTILSFIFGFLQLFSIYKYPNLEILRILLSWLIGCFWLWVGIVSTNYHISPEDLAAISLGLGCLYSFIINFNLVSLIWKN